MLAFWHDLLEPLLRCIRPSSVVEIGSEHGKTTRLLLELSKTTRSTIYSIDPAPLFDVDALRREHGTTFVFYRNKSLEVLGQLTALDVVLIDGDHNWYTVHEELWTIERRVRELDLAPPIVVLHDIGWPYGRRDLYYDPSGIPADCCRPWRRAGIHPLSRGLVERGGINGHLCNAVEEGGPRNGVLTAVEDYLAETKMKFEFVRVPAAFGLGILVPKERVAQRPELRDLLIPWADERVSRFIERLEMARIGLLIGYQEPGPPARAACSAAVPPAPSGAEPRVEPLS